MTKWLSAIERDPVYPTSILSNTKADLGNGGTQTHVPRPLHGAEWCTPQYRPASHLHEHCYRYTPHGLCNLIQTNSNRLVHEPTLNSKIQNHRVVSGPSATDDILSGYAHRTHTHPQVIILGSSHEVNLTLDMRIFPKRRELTLTHTCS